MVAVGTRGAPTGSQVDDGPCREVVTSEVGCGVRRDDMIFVMPDSLS